MAFELAEDITTADLLQASVVLLAFGFLLPRTLLRDFFWGSTPMRGHVSGYIFAAAVWGLSTSALASILGSKSIAAQSLLFGLGAISLLAFLQVQWIADCRPSFNAKWIWKHRAFRSSRPRRFFQRTAGSHRRFRQATDDNRPIPARRC